MEASFQQLAMHDRFIRSLARGLIGDVHQAEDLAQDAWLAYLQKPPKSKGKPIAWFLGTMKNLARMHYRSASRRRRREYAAAMMQPDGNHDGSLEEKEIRDRLVQVLGELEEGVRKVLLLRFFDELSYLEIAAQMEIPVGTIKSRMNLGLKLMRKRLDGVYDGRRETWTLLLLPLASRQEDASNEKSASPSSLLQQGHRRPARWFKPLVPLLAAALILAWMIRLEPFGIGERAEENPPIDDALASSTKEPAPTSGSQAYLPREAVSPGQASDPSPLPPLLAAWTGTVIDYTDLPLADVEIILEPPGEVSGLPPSVKNQGQPLEEKGHARISARSDSLGAFTLEKIPVGRYKVSLIIERTVWAESTPQRWGEIVFDAPGIVRRDIRLLDDANGAVQGRVVWERSERPVTGHEIMVELVSHPAQNLLVSARVNPDTGLFRFRCIPEDRYQFVLRGPGGYNRFFLTAFPVAAGRIKDDLVLVVPPLGVFTLRLEGFGDDERKALSIYMLPSRSLATHFNEVPVEKSLEFEEGPIRVSVRHPELGAFERTVLLAAGGRETLTVNRADLAPDDALPLNLEGTVYGPDETPLNRAVLEIASAPQGKGIAFKPLGTSGEDGTFRGEAFPPGFYAVTCSLYHPADLDSILATGKPRDTYDPVRIVFFNEVEVRETAPGQAAVSLRLPAGVVRGRVFDSFTGKPIHEATPAWNAAVKESKRFISHVAVFVDSHTTHRLEVIGIPPGDYHLEIKAPNFNLLQRAFSIKEGEDLDLGDLYMDPCGTLDLVVVDEEGRPILNFALTCQDRLMGVGQHLNVRMDDPLLGEPPRWRYSGLTVGDVTVRIKSPGYEDQERTVAITAGTPLAARVVLKRN